MVPATCGNSHYKKVVFKRQGDDDRQPFPLVRLYSFCFDFGIRIHQFAASWVQKIICSVVVDNAFLPANEKKKKYWKRSLTLIWGPFSHVHSVLILIHLIGGLPTNLKATHSPRSPSMYGARSLVTWGRRGAVGGSGCRWHRVMSRILIILIRWRLVYREMHFGLLLLSIPTVPLSW